YAPQCHIPFMLPLLAGQSVKPVTYTVSTQNYESPRNDIYHWHLRTPADHAACALMLSGRAVSPPRAIIHACTPGGYMPHRTAVSCGSAWRGPFTGSTARNAA